MEPKNNRDEANFDFDFRRSVMTRYAVFASLMAGAILIQVGCDRSGAADNSGATPASTAKVSGASPQSTADKNTLVNSGTKGASAVNRTGPFWHADEVSFNFGEL